MNKPFLRVFLLLVTLTAVLASCKSSKDYVYLKDLNPGVYQKEPIRPAIVKPGDRLSIYVLTEKQELALPFNSRMGYRVSTENGDVQQGTSGSTELTQGYLVDQNGDIEFPVLGKLQVSGLTLQGVSDLVKSKITEEGRLKDPVVTTELLNFNVYILGQNSQNTQTVSQTLSTRNGQLTLLQAIARLDLSGSYKLNNIKVIREIDNQRFVYEVNLQTKDLYNSPAYYLQQNDMIYIEPRYRMRDEVNIALRYMSVVTAISSFATTMIYLFKK